MLNEKKVAFSSNLNAQEEDLEEDQSEASAVGVHRYDNMLKSMIARLEVTGSLIPV